MSDHQGNVIFGTIIVVVAVCTILGSFRKSLSITGGHLKWGLAILSVAAFIFGAYGYHVGAVSAPYATWLCVGSAVIGVIGCAIYQVFEEEDNRVVPTPPTLTPNLPTFAPTPDIYGTSRAATREEAHRALGGKGNPQSQYDYEE